MNEKAASAGEWMECELTGVDDELASCCRDALGELRGASFAELRAKALDASRRLLTASLDDGAGRMNQALHLLAADTLVTLATMSLAIDSGSINGEAIAMSRAILEEDAAR